jgi:hypothetical protein
MIMDKKCVLCDRIWGVFGIALGVLIIGIGADLLSGGVISRLIGTPKPVTDSGTSEMEFEDDDESIDE